MKWLVVLLMFFSASVFAISYEEAASIHKSVLNRFQYVESDSDEVFQYYHTDDFVEGDCDDFASAVYFELWKRKLNPVIVMYRVKGRGYHVITCTNDYCFDNNLYKPYPYKNLDAGQNHDTIVGKLQDKPLKKLLEK